MYATIKSFSIITKPSLMLYCTQEKYLKELFKNVENKGWGKMCWAHAHKRQTQIAIIRQVEFEIKTLRQIKMWRVQFKVKP